MLIWYACIAMFFAGHCVGRFVERDESQEDRLSTLIAAVVQGLCWPAFAGWWLLDWIGGRLK